MKTLLLLLMAGAGSAPAAVLSYSHTTLPQSAPFDDTFTLNKFDPSLGVLDGISITFAANTVAEVDIFSISPFAQAFGGAFASVPLVLTTPSGILQATPAAGPFTGSVDPGFSSFPGQMGGASSSLNVAISNFALYTGAGGATNSFSVAGRLGTYGGSSVAGVFFGGSANVGGVTTIDYSYNAAFTTTPEPQTFQLFALAFAGFGLKLGTKLVKRKNRPL